MLITIKWQAADTMPAIMHHFSGNGSIAYGTNTMNKTYQTRYSRSENPTPSPTKPAENDDENCHRCCIVL